MATIVLEYRDRRRYAEVPCDSGSWVDLRVAPERPKQDGAARGVTSAQVRAQAAAFGSGSGPVSGATGFGLAFGGRFISKVYSNGELRVGMDLDEAFEVVSGHEGLEGVWVNGSCVWSVAQQLAVEYATSPVGRGAQTRQTPRPHM